MNHFSVLRIFIFSALLMIKITVNAQEVEESGPRTIVKGFAEIKELDSLYARDLVIKRDVEIPDSLGAMFVFPDKIAEGIINIARQQVVEGTYLLTISDRSGKEYFQKWINFKGDSKLFAVQIPDLLNGDYYVVLNISKGKYLKQKITICK